MASINMASINEETVYMYVYNDILTHHLYDQKYFSTYAEFREFCKKDFNEPVMLYAGALQQAITEKIREYYLTHNSKTGKPNEPITYFKYTFRK